MWQLIAVVTFAAIGLHGCGKSVHGPTALYDNTSARTDFFALPWPSDARLTRSGTSTTFDMSGFYNPGGTIGSYVTLLSTEALGGFGTSSGIFFRFDGAIDPASLPQSAMDSIAATASVYVVDVTPGSPTVGMRAPLRMSFKSDYGMYIGPNSLALLPEPGFPLRSKTTYAAIVTDAVRGTNGAAAIADTRFVLPAMPMVPAGLDKAHVISATVFTTYDTVSGMKALRDAVYAAGPMPAIDDGSLTWVASVPGVYDQYQGTFASPNFQQGAPPYIHSGGGIQFDNGVPQIARIEHLRFMVTVPNGDPPPAAGWPIVIYAHGTGGDYSTFVEDNSAYNAASVKDSDGNVIARMAMISTDQPNAGPRDPTGTNPELTTYNFQNLPAGRDIFRQSGTDDFQLLRLVGAINVTSAPHTGSPIQFDASRVYFKGHSEGGNSGPLFLAYEPGVNAAVLSGAGANLILALLEKTQPLDIPPLVSAVVGEDVDPFHPLMSLMQTYLEPADPANYGRFFFRETPIGIMPKSVYQSLGIVDNFTPMDTIKALAEAMEVQPINPMLTPLADLPLEGLSWGNAPVMNNVGNGLATGVLCEYQVPLNQLGMQVYDGHFVVFQNEAAIQQSNRFLAHAAAGGTAILDP